MQNLKNNLLLVSCICFNITACQSTKTFNLKKFPVTPQSHQNDLHIIQVDSNRVKQKCLFLNAEAENNWRNQYFMYVLNNKNEVLEIMYAINTDKDFCRSHIRAIEKMLAAEQKIEICVRDELKKVQESAIQKELVSFGSLGTHKVTYVGLTFDSVCNSKKCVGDNSAWVDTCPGFAQR